ncbi:MAG: MarR family transcriptional regulator [Methyloceanibacter sp.]|nr:MarR family transcriptional regulator [Methyloceanibacter sp.]
MTKRYSEALEPAGVNVTQFAQLLAISDLKAPTISELAKDTELDRSTLGRNIRVLEKMNLIRFGPGDDERTRLIGLTSRGKKVLKTAVPLWNSIQASVAEELGAGRAELLNLLSILKAETP